MKAILSIAALSIVLTVLQHDWAFLVLAATAIAVILAVRLLARHISTNPDDYL